jgi:hypothetical protein
MFLATIAQYYRPGFGFTALIQFPESSHDYEISAVREAPHYHHPDADGYDGQFYAQLAVDPLLRDGAIDRAMDNPQYRARRILLSWTAYAIGGGNPARVLQVYAIQNVVVWLILAWLLCRWMPPTDGRRVALWAGCLLSHGMLSSVRLALPDGPSALLIAAAVAVAGGGASLAAGPGGRLFPRLILAAWIVGLAGLARETGILSGSMFVRELRRDWWTWGLVAVCLVLCALPLLLWMDYLRSIYRFGAAAGTDHLTTPLSGVLWKVLRLRTDLAGGDTSSLVASAAALTGFLVQAWVIGSELTRSSGRSPWALVGASFVILAVFTHRDVFAGTPGAFTRVFLPMTLSANALLAARPRPDWGLIVMANLAVIPGIMLLRFAWS